MCEMHLRHLNSSLRDVLRKEFILMSADLQVLLATSPPSSCPFYFFHWYILYTGFCRKYGLRFARIPADQLIPALFFYSAFYWFFFTLIYILGEIKLDDARLYQRYNMGMQVLEYEMDALPVDFFHCFYICFWLLKSFFISFPSVPMIPGLAGLHFADKVETVRRQYPNAFIFAADDYKTSAVLNFYLNEMVYSKNIVGQKALQFDFIGYQFARLKWKRRHFHRFQPPFS